MKPTQTDNGVTSHKNISIVNPEVKPKKKRRLFTAAKKLAILEMLDRCPAGDRGEIMRREGVYSSSICEWRKARARGELSALHEKRGRKLKHTPEKKQTLALQLENERLKKKLAHAEAIIDLQKKVSEIFGLNLPQKPTDDSD